MRITLPGYINDFLHGLMVEMGFNKSDLIEQLVFYVSMPENLEEFKNQFELAYADEDDEDQEEEEDDDEDDDDDEEE